MKDTTSSQAAKILSQLGASKGGKARAKNLSPERKREIAQQAAHTRWAAYRLTHRETSVKQITRNESTPVSEGA